MLKDKNTPQTKVADSIVNTYESIPEEVQSNPFIEMYQAVKRAILSIRENPDNPLSPPYFKTIQIDNGQFQRIIRDENSETEIAFPAIFVHFINIRYLVQQQRIGQGRATMRIRFILNNLNNQDDDKECEPFMVFQWVNVAIQDAKSKEPALNERCNLLYFDMPTTTNMLQAYWVDYEVWFRESSAWKYRDWVEKYVVMPPFTNHRDAPIYDNDNHGDHKKPTDRDVIGFVPSVENSKDEDINMTEMG